MGRVRALTERERAEIAELTHAEFLRLLLVAGSYKAEELIFHGGTSLKLVHGSPRHSEDLDFIVAAAASDRVAATAASVMPQLSAALAARYPKARAEWRPKVRRGRMFSAFVVVRSPHWHQNVKVKVECYTAHDMRRYLVSQVNLVPGVVVPVATREAILADKVVALAMRPYFKTRDVFDVWWLRAHGVGLSLDAIEASAAVYDYTLPDITDGLSRLAERMPTCEALAEDLVRWLPPELHEAFSRSGLFDELLATTLSTCDEAQRLAP